jgi:hypothetical protein
MRASLPKVTNLIASGKYERDDWAKVVAGGSEEVVDKARMIPRSRWDQRYRHAIKDKERLFVLHAKPTEMPSHAIPADAS